MTKEEAVVQIREHLIAVRDIAREFGVADYLNLSVIDRNDGYISFSTDQRNHQSDGKHISYAEFINSGGDLVVIREDDPLWPW